MKILKIGFLIMLCLFTIFQAHAALIAYEGFNYPIGSTLSNQAGGLGWLAPWTGANLGGVGTENNEIDFVITNGYSWSNSTGGYITGQGGAIFDHDAANPAGEFRQWFDPTTDITTTWGSNIWFSFIATYDVASGSGGSVNAFEAAADPVGGFGVVCTSPAGGGQFVVQLRVAPYGQGAHTGPTANLVSSQNGTNLVVGRFQLGAVPANPTFGSGNDRLDVWLNQTSEPTNGSDLYFTGFATYRTFPYSSGNAGIRTGGACEMTIDEFRIGSSFADVVPSTAKSPNPKPAPPVISLQPAGPMGLQFNLSEATPTNSNEIFTYYTTNSNGQPVPLECTWVGKTPATYSFTVAQPPASGPTNFMAYMWLIPNPNGHVQALDNPNALQLALISDGHGGATAVLGYYANGTTSVQQNSQTLFNSGVICTIPNAPFAGTWTVTATSDTSFTIGAPNGAQASGSMQAGDQANFSSGVTWFLGVSPNGGPNTGAPALGYYMTVSGMSISNNSDGLVVTADWSTGHPFQNVNPPNFLVLANFPSCIYTMPSNSLYRASWRNAVGPGVGANALTETNVLGAAAGNWSNAVPSTAVLSNGTNVTFVTREFATNPAAFFRVSVPFTP